jgi:hypothetical protein
MAAVVHPMSQADIGWLAGIVEGEGSFKTNGRTGIALEVAMTDQDVVQRLQDVTGVGRVNGPYWAKKSTKPYWTWTVGKKAALARLVLAIYPLLGSRRQGRVADLLDRFSFRPIHRRPGGRWCYPNHPDARSAA